MDQLWPWQAAAAGVLLAGLSAAAATPGEELNLRLAAPITTWDEALPLGNGLLGGLLWGQGQTVRLSLDRGDLWDERPVTEHSWRVSVAQVAENNCNLDIKNPSSQEALAHRPPGELVESILAKERRIAEIMAALKATLEKTDV